MRYGYPLYESYPIMPSLDFSNKTHINLTLRSLKTTFLELKLAVLISQPESQPLRALEMRIALLGLILSPSQKTNYSAFSAPMIITDLVKLVRFSNYRSNTYTPDSIKAYKYHKMLTRELPIFGRCPHSPSSLTISIDLNQCQRYNLLFPPSD